MFPSAAKNGSRGNYKKELHRRFIQLLISSLVGQLSPNIDRIERSHWPFDAVLKTSFNDMHLAFLIQHASVNKSAHSIIVMYAYGITIGRYKPRPGNPRISRRASPKDGIKSRDAVMTPRSMRCFVGVD